MQYYCDIFIWRIIKIIPWKMTFYFHYCCCLGDEKWSVIMFGANHMLLIRSIYVFTCVCIFIYMRDIIGMWLHPGNFGIFLKKKLYSSICIYTSKPLQNDGVPDGNHSVSQRYLCHLHPLLSAPQLSLCVLVWHLYDWEEKFSFLMTERTKLLILRNKFHRLKWNLCTALQFFLFLAKKRV